MDDVKRAAARHKIDLVILSTADAIKALRKTSKDTNAVLLTEWWM